MEGDDAGDDGPISKDNLSDTHTVDDNMSVMTFAEDFAFVEGT